MAQFYVTAHEDWDGLTSDFAYWLWNASMTPIPYDTGNLRSSYNMKNNSQKRIRYGFDKTKAYYIDYLEEGVGPVTKYKGFIKNQMVGILVQELLAFISTNKVGSITTKPRVELRISQHKRPFPYERRILKEMGTRLNYLSADERRSLSKIMYRSKTGNISNSYAGRTPSIKRAYRRDYNAKINSYYIDGIE